MNSIANVISIAGLCILMVACKQPASTSQTLPTITMVEAKTHSVGDTSIIAVISGEAVTEQMGKPFALSKEDHTAVENILRNCLAGYNPTTQKEYDEYIAKHPTEKLDLKGFIIDLNRYKRQYVPYINAKGEKEVWINCFCHHWDEDWKKSIIMVEDGGNCYWQVKINLTTGKYYDLIVNGDA